MTCRGATSCYSAVVDVKQTQNVRLWCYEGVSACGLTLNASYSDSVAIDCYEESTCSNGNFGVDNAKSAQFNASGSSAMSNVDIYAEHMVGDLKVFCDAQSGCERINVYLGTMTGTFNLKCAGYLSCDSADVYGASANGQYVIHWKWSWSL